LQREVRCKGEKCASRREKTSNKWKGWRLTKWEKDRIKARMRGFHDTALGGVLISAQETKAR